MSSNPAAPYRRVDDGALAATTPRSRDAELLVLVASLFVLLASAFSDPFDARVCALGVLGMLGFAAMMRSDG